ncbi:MAG: efflux RND transporter periplasmic adaptor subunit [Desulfobacteraceae bacterium]|nr:efflux RND transporter periplasmic adaptor subunit [Desulfobacteraceae bacterium]MBC2757883.1 efflux RND transporter periplasmic adaptor subunit [Desulfobacteraceae bacterium]
MSRAQKIFIQGIITILIIVIGVAGFTKLKAGKKAIERQKPEVPLPMVRTVTVNTGPMQIILTGQGSAKPVQEIQLVPQVNGKIVEVASSLVNGGMFRTGDILLSIEPVDYEISVTLAEARVKEAESLFKLAQEESAAAGDEWRRHNSNEEPPPLVVKEPQLAAARALLEAERSNLKEARLNLERTRLTAPFNGRVVSENVDIGQYVSPGQSLATLHSTDAAEIVIPLEDQDLFWFDVPGFTTNSQIGAAAEVKAVVAGKEVRWAGRVVRSEGRINKLTRMHNVVVQVEKPYASLPPLAAGQFVEIEIYGRTIDHATVIPRVAMRENQTVWIVNPEESRLYFRKVDVARSTHAGLVIEDGLSNNEMVVISSLKAVGDGMKVRFVENNGGNS